MLITNYNVKDTFLTKDSFININNKVNFIKSLLRKHCPQTKLKFSLKDDKSQNSILGNFELSSSSAYSPGMYSKFIFYLKENDNYIIIVSMLNPAKEKVIDLLMYIFDYYQI